MWIGIGVKITNWWRRAAANGPFSNHATLPDGLVSAWPISADGFDVHGTNDLTNNNTVTFVAKGVGAPANMPANVANFVAASSQFFSDGDLLGADATASASLWFMVDDVAAGYTILDMAGGQFYLRSNAGFVQLNVRGFADLVTQGGGPISPNTWYHVVVWHDAVGNEIGVHVGGRTATTAATGGANGDPTTFRLGNRGDDAQPLNGKMSSVYLWPTRVITADERTDLYASGDGLFY